MYGFDKLLGGIVLAVLTVAGLLISANAHDVGFTFFGYLLFLFGVLMLFRFVALLTEDKGAQP